MLFFIRKGHLINALLLFSLRVGGNYTVARRRTVLARTAENLVFIQRANLSVTCSLIATPGEGNTKHLPQAMSRVFLSIIIL